MSNFPKISIVTPSFNQGRFLEQTILSVLGQGYPNLEYIVMDGGSSDNSVDIIKEYEEKLTYWTSKKDNGQSNAINLGFARCTGDILCWLNSDDYLLPNTLFNVAALFNQNKNVILFGNCIHLNEYNHYSYASDVVKSFLNHPLEIYDPIIQPSSFWTRSVLETVGSLREDLHYVFDWEWFLRAKKSGVEFIPVENYFSVYRIHEGHKSGSGGKRRIEEIKSIIQTFHSNEMSEIYGLIHLNKDKIRDYDIFLKKFKISRWRKIILSFKFPFLGPLTEKELSLLLTMS